MAGYCDPADVYSYGLPRGAVSNPGRLASSALAADGWIALDVHGFADGETVTLRADAGGYLPTPLSEGVEYFAAEVTDSTFKVAATSGGAAIAWTADGSRVIVIAAVPMVAAIAWASRLIDDMLPAHVVPLEAPYPEIVRMTSAELAAGKLAARSGATSVALASIVDAAHKRLERWGKGVPIRGENTPTRAGLAATAVVPYLDRQGWQRFGGL